MSDRLAEIRARLDAATPGPWENTDDWSVVTAVVRQRSKWLPDYEMLVADVGQPVNADLIAHAPADIAWLLAENDAFREQIEFLKDDNSRIAAQRDQYKKRWHEASA